MRILFIGDIVANPGRKTVEKVLPDIIGSDNIGVVIANAENLAHGRGVTESVVREMMNAGVDYFTGGDHLFWQKGFEDVIDSLPIIRPANYPAGTPGSGSAVVDCGEEGKILLINLIGRTFLNERLDDPFRKADEILSTYKKDDFKAIIVDFHAEASSEKTALAFYLDGRVSAVIGTHTHIPSADLVTLPKGTQFAADAGMTGNIDSVLGVKKDIIIRQYMTALNQKFEWEEEGRCAFRSILLDTDTHEFKRIDKYLE